MYNEGDAVWVDYPILNRCYGPFLAGVIKEVRLYEGYEDDPIYSVQFSYYPKCKPSPVNVVVGLRGCWIKERHKDAEDIL